MSLEFKVAPIQFSFIEVISSSVILESLLPVIFDNRVRLNPFFNYQVEDRIAFLDYMVNHFSHENRFLYLATSSNSSEFLGTIGALIDDTECELTYVMKFKTSQNFSFSPIFEQFLEFVSKCKNITRFTLTVKQDNQKARAFYQKFGFVELQDTPNVLNSIHMTKSVSP